MAIIYDLSKEEIAGILQEWDEMPYRTNQIWNGLYKNFWLQAVEFTNLSSQLIKKLDKNLDFLPFSPVKELWSKDQSTEKLLFKLQDGNEIETVLMKYKRGNTLCISSQAGCGMGCKFCATGQMGFRRNLTKGEIIAQVMFFSAKLTLIGEKLTNIVIMGMGEPFHNYDNVIGAIDRLNESDGFNFGERRFTISTVGLIPLIDRFGDENRQINLAISLHSVDDDVRTQMMPVNTKYPIHELIESCKRYLKKTNRRITFEWVLISGVNDGEKQALQLVEQIKGMLCHVNLIPLNPTSLYQGSPTKLSSAGLFRKILTDSGIKCTIRLRRGIDIMAGCGQLASSAH